MKKILSSTSVFLLKVLSYLPLSILYGISSLFYVLIYKIVKYRRRVVRENLSNAFPDYDVKQLDKIESSFYAYLCDLILETIKGYRMSRAAVKKRVVFNETKIYDDLFAQGKSGIVVLGHQGNWEWVCKAAPLWVKNRLVIVYKPLSDKNFEEFMIKTRSEFGAIQVPMSGVAKFILTQKEPFLLILLADQTPTDSRSSHWIQFLNQDTAILPGPAKLSKKYNLPIIYHGIRKIKRGYYECTPKLIVDSDTELDELSISKAHVKELEEEIKYQPETWLWSHRRWKLKR